MLKPINYSEFTPEHAHNGCLVIGMSNEDYHAYDAISKSGLDLIDRSPAHFSHQEPREATRAMAIGTAIHTAIFEPERFQSDYLLLRDVTDRRSSEYKQAIKTHDAELVLTRKEADHVAGMQETVRSNASAYMYLNQEGWGEISVFATCPVTEVLIKCRFDWLTKTGVAIDLKKTQDIRYEKVQRSIANYRYHVQDGFYRHVFSCATGTELEDFKFLFVEESMPHASKLFTLDTEGQRVGARVAGENLATYAACLESNDWPYPDATDELISLPSWALDEEDMLEVSL